MTTRLAASGLTTILCFGFTALLPGCGEPQDAEPDASARPVIEVPPSEGAEVLDNADPALSPMGSLPGTDFGMESASAASPQAPALDPDYKPSAHDDVPMAPDPTQVPELADAVWKVFLASSTGSPDPSLERLSALSTYDGVPVEFYEESWPDGDLRLQGHRTLGTDGSSPTLHGPEWRWYDNGQVQLRRNYKGGQSNGRFDEWHESGFKKSEGHFVNDQLSGDWSRWHSMGSLWKVQHWLNGLDHGKQWVFFDSGAVSQLVEWDQGKKSGADHNWNKRGFPIEDSQWKNGKRHGHHLQWHGREKRAVEKHFVDGKAQGPWLEWWPDGTERLSGQMENGKRTGEWLVWSDAGVLITRENYLEGEFHGARKAWSNEGILIFEGSFEGGQPVQVQKSYFAGGGPKTSQTYSTPGIQSGPMMAWHPNGKKASEGEMLDGKRQGKWSLWDESGKYLKAWSGTYEAGERVGD